MAYAVASSSIPGCNLFMALPTYILCDFVVYLTLWIQTISKLLSYCFFFLFPNEFPLLALSKRCCFFQVCWRVHECLFLSVGLMLWEDYRHIHLLSLPTTQFSRPHHHRPASCLQAAAEMPEDRDLQRLVVVGGCHCTAAGIFCQDNLGRFWWWPWGKGPGQFYSLGLIQGQ